MNKFLITGLVQCVGLIVVFDSDIDFLKKSFVLDKSESIEKAYDVGLGYLKEELAQKMKTTHTKWELLESILWKPDKEYSPQNKWVKVVHLKF